MEERADLQGSRAALPAAEAGCETPLLCLPGARSFPRCPSCSPGCSLDQTVCLWPCVEVVVAGETGSGKTTQCPNFILEASGLRHGCRCVRQHRQRVEVEKCPSFARSRLSARVVSEYRLAMISHSVLPTGHLNGLVNF